MNTKKILTDNLAAILDEAYKDAFFINPDIPEKKISNAIKNIANDCSENDIVAVVDGTIFGSVKEGFVFTETTLYSRISGEIVRIDYKDIENINPGDDKMEICTKSGTSIIIESSGFYRSSGLAKLLTLLANGGIHSSESDIFKSRNLSVEYLVNNFGASIVTEEKRFTTNFDLSVKTISTFSKAVKAEPPLSCKNVIAFADISSNCDGKEGIAFTNECVYLKDGFFKAIHGVKYENIGDIVPVDYHYNVYAVNSVPLYESITNKECFLPQNFIYLLAAIKNREDFFPVLDVLIAYGFAGNTEDSEIETIKTAISSVILSKYHFNIEQGKLEEEINYVKKRETEAPYSTIQTFLENEKLNRKFCFENLIHLVAFLNETVARATYFRKLRQSFNLSKEDELKARKNIVNFYVTKKLRGEIDTIIEEEYIINKMNTLVDRAVRESDDDAIVTSRKKVEEIFDNYPQNEIGKMIFEWKKNVFDKNPILYEFLAEKDDEDIEKFLTGIPLASKLEKYANLRELLLNLPKTNETKKFFNDLFTATCETVDDGIFNMECESIGAQMENEEETLQLIDKFDEIFRRATDGTIVKGCKNVEWQNTAVYAFVGVSLYIAQEADYASGTKSFVCRYTPSLAALNDDGETPIKTFKFDLKIDNGQSFLLEVEYNNNGISTRGNFVGSLLETSDFGDITVEHVFHMIGHREYAQHLKEYIKTLYDLYEQSDQYKQHKNLRDMDEL